MRKRFFQTFVATALATLTAFGTFGLNSSISSAENTHLVSMDTNKTAIVQRYNVEMPNGLNSSRSPLTYYGGIASVFTLVDGNNNINIAYRTATKLVIKKMDGNMKVASTIEIPYRFPLFGDIVCDGAGNYYIFWGKADTEAQNIDNLAISKFDNNGKLIYEKTFKGYETTAYNIDSYGTKVPFDAGSCDMTIHNGILAVNFARTMYNGHQSNMTVYFDTSSMKRKFGYTGYTSHSFDQRIYGLSDGSFAILNHGDAYNRSFSISKSRTLTDSFQYTYDGMTDIDNFHFREGENRSHGYNMTFAQMGGLAEVDGGYVFAAASERALSLMPTDTSKGGHNAARDLFIQIFKKNFGGFSGADQYAVAGETRRTEGNKPLNSETELFLGGMETDYGVIWLTSYGDDYFAANPKVVAVDHDKVAVMWEKRQYKPAGNVSWNNSTTPTPITTYMTVIDDKGNVVIDTMKIPDTFLTSDTDPVYLNGKIYWASNDITGSGRLTCVDPRMYEGVEKEVHLNISQTEATVRMGQNLQLTANTDNAAAKKTITWTSSDTKIATVDNSGKITPVSVGEVVISANSWIGGVKASCKVQVKPIAVQSVALNTATLALSVGQTAQLTAIVTPANAGDKTVNWFSSDNKIISVDKDGNVRALMAGEADVIVNTTDGWLENKCHVTVTGAGNAYRADLQNSRIPMHRLYNPNSGEHFYTADDHERDALRGYGWRVEDDAWTAPGWSTIPVYRMYNPNAGDHHYTTKKIEVDALAKAGWNYEGIAWYSDPAQAVPLHRLYNPNAVSGSHHYTADPHEKDVLVSYGWRYEEIGWYGCK